MRQVRIRTTCDPCQAWHGAEIEEGVQTVPVAGGQTLDLCPEHRASMQPFLSLVAEWGAAPAKVKGSASRRDQVTQAAQRLAPSNGAEAPPEAGKAPNRRGGKRARARRANSEQATTELALSCPLCQRPAASTDALGHHLRLAHHTTIGETFGSLCPLCGEEGRGTHLSRVHSLSGGIPAAFALAQQQGDPHGVIAARAVAMAGH